MRPDENGEHTSSRTADKFVLRLPDGMRERIAIAAAGNDRSMNSELVRRIDRSFVTAYLVEKQSQLIQQLSDRIKELEDRA